MMPESHDDRRRGCRVPVDDRPAGLSRPDGGQQLSRARHRPHRGLDIRAAFEAIRRVGRETDPFAGTAHRDRVEIRRLQDDRPGRAADLRVGAAHHAGHRLCPCGVGDDQHLRLEPALHAVEGPDRFPGPRASHPDFGAGEPVEVERVHRVAELEHDVIGHVNHVVDRPDVGRLESRRQPARRWSDLDIHQRAHIAGAQVSVFDRHPDRVPLVAIVRPQLWYPQVGAIHGADLARDAEHRQTVGAVGRDLEIEHGVGRFVLAGWAGLAGRVRRAGRPGLDRPDLEPAHDQCVSQLSDVDRAAGADRQRDELPQPGDQDSQWGNCSNSRRSLS